MSNKLNEMNKIINNIGEHRRQAELNKIEREIESLEIRIKEFKEIKWRLKTESAIKMIENSIKEMKKLKRKRSRMIPRVIAEMI
jgi:hypothetical protein